MHHIINSIILAYYYTSFVYEWFLLNTNLCHFDGFLQLLWPPITLTVTIIQLKFLDNLFVEYFVILLSFLLFSLFFCCLKYNILYLLLYFLFLSLNLHHYVFSSTSHCIYMELVEMLTLLHCVLRFTPPIQLIGTV